MGFFNKGSSEDTDGSCGQLILYVFLRHSDYHNGGMDSDEYIWIDRFEWTEMDGWVWLGRKGGRD